MKKKIKIVILFGGRSAEHEVSVQSARSVYKAINKTKYDVVLIGIDKKGEFHYLPAENHALLLTANNPTVSLEYILRQNKIIQQINPFDVVSFLKNVDVVFPVVHGPNIEDGTIQGFLKLINVPFIGPSVLGGAITMDKDITKRLLRDAGIPIGKFLTYRLDEKNNLDYDTIVKYLGSPFFVKPPTLGSSIGVSKVHTNSELKKAVDLVFQYDNKILIEEFIKGREIECSVLGNENPQASIPGEVIPANGHEFYDYDAKYIDEKGASLKIPAVLDDQTITKVKHLAVQTFQTLSCVGMSRVDMFLKEDGKLFINEINPIPGFTKISMYPKLWEASGTSYTELIDRLIELALERFKNENKLQTNFL